LPISGQSWAWPISGQISEWPISGLNLWQWSLLGSHLLVPEWRLCHKAVSQAYS